MPGLTPPADPRSDLVLRLERIARDAAAVGAGVVREAAGRLGSVSMKSSPTDPVTSLDLAVEGVIRAHLAEQTPDASFLGEESGARDGGSRLGWVLDPIDGTVNLTYDIPYIAVSLAATLDGEVVAGAVVDIWRDETFSTAAGHGARFNGSPAAVSSVGELPQALVATGFDYSSSGRAAQVDFVGRVLPAARDIRCFGSSALQLCWVACGRVDAYFQRDLKRWDYAAGALIAAEAGARLQWPSDENRQLLVAAGPGVFDQLLALLA
jgi:myo-inositol-1(or 4)-monophosphatase